MIFRTFSTDSAEYQASLVLREAVLRKPLGLVLSEQDLANEDKQLHFGLFEQEQISAVVLLKPVGDLCLKLRQMAVASGQQGKGFGKALIQQAEQEAKAQGYERIEMAARESAVPFYQNLGYEIVSEPFEEVGITHIKMAKVL